MDLTRRTAITAAAAPLFVPKRVFGANDRIVYGLIASGGRGRYLSTMFNKVGAQCAAVCDVYEPNLQKALSMNPGAKGTVEYKEVLENKEIDAVVIASPDHQHYPMLIDSLDAGKDVYLEKPLSKSLEESGKMIQAVRKSKQVVQIGMQRRSAPMVQKARSLVSDGVLGRITHVRPQWFWNTSRPLNNTPLDGKLDWKRFLGNARKRELEPMRFRHWRYFYDYAGGNMTDQGTHLMDVVQWFTGVGAPKAAIAHGYVAKMQGAEHPDVFTSVFEYPDMMVTWTLNYNNSFQNGWSIMFQGDKATMLLDDAGYKVYAEPWKRDAPPIYEENAPVPVEAHVQNFLDSIKTRKDPNCTVEIAAQAVAGPHLANLAMLKGRKVELTAKA